MQRVVVVSYRFFLFLIDAMRNGDIVFIAGYPHQHPPVHQYTLNDLKKEMAQRNTIPVDDEGITSLDPDAIVTIRETDSGEWYPVARKELIGHEIRMEVRSIVNDADPKGFEAYKEMKSEADSADERLDAYAFLLYRFFTKTPKEYDSGFQIRLSIVDLAVIHTGFDRALLGDMEERDAVKYIVRHFLEETYLTTQP